tara:strand:+ start:1156 stop:1830 length:675 start_codon:yes stop_codon:yes gene_type:complete
MSEFLELSNIQLATTTISEFIVGFLTTVILSLVIKYIYQKYSNSVSNKKIISSIFPLFSLSIFLIVVTIKSSIVLSLGLVGALSIIRFRTAIKEAEQIVYFLILTAISISTAAASFIFPFLLVFFVYIYAYNTFKRKSGKVLSVNDQIVIGVTKIKNEEIHSLVKLLNENNVNVEVQSINKQDHLITLVLKVSDFELGYLSIIEDFLKKNRISKKEIQFFSSSE